ncbi:MAG: delta-60 repeat domain-containing protein, partial [Flavobacteriales bacterium]|nr:delta-60 repeat domain-containing protein [Flavobacteriales bacterium]
MIPFMAAAAAMKGYAQQPFDLDTSFSTNISVWYVSSILPQDDGKVLLSGRIKFPGDTDFRFVTRINSDGTQDNTFPAAVPGGGKLASWTSRVYVGTTQTVRRLWPDGSIDTDFIGMNLGPYFSSSQGGDYHVYPDGRILMSGSHILTDSIRGYMGYHCLVWFSNTGYLDTTAHHRTCAGSLDFFTELPNGKFIGSGSTGIWDGQAASNIIRFHADGALD